MSRYVTFARFFLPFAAFTAAGLLPLRAARADEANDWVKRFDAPPERRSGVVLGLELGAGVAGSSGYPNGANNLGAPAFYSQSNAMLGTGFKLAVMGALADTVNFGFWVGSSTFASANWTSTGTAGGIRVEGFPLYYMMPRLKDLGLIAQFGIGGTTLTTKRAGAYPSADGTQSFIGAGVFYEWTLVAGKAGHVVLGPSLEYDVIESTSIERHGAMLSARLAYYGGK
jgi:hypothetical protein